MRPGSKRNRLLPWPRIIGGLLMQVVPVTLVGRAVRLEPLHLDHAAALWQVSEPGFFAYFPSPPAGPTLDDFRAFLAAIQARAAWCPFTTVLQATGQPIGLT